jgi:hypothetical protein
LTVQKLGERTTLGSNDTALSQSIVEQLEVRLLEEALSRALRVRRVSDDDIKGVLVLGKELESVTNVDLDLGVVESSRHVREVLLGETNDGLGTVSA